MIVRASRNLKNLWTVTAGDLSLVHVLKADTIIAPVETLDMLEKSNSASAKSPSTAKAAAGKSKVKSKN
jgi:hypothetical protein